MKRPGKERGKETRERAAKEARGRENGKKMLNLYGTNRRSPLESTKVSKKQTQTRSKQTGKTCSKQAKKPKQSERLTPKGHI
jgi:hypothetical protein